MTGQGDLNINRPTTRSDGGPRVAYGTHGTAASFLSLKGTNPVDDGDAARQTSPHWWVSRETGLLLDIVNRNGRDAWAAVPITHDLRDLRVERSSGSKPIAQASSSKVSVSFNDDIDNAMRAIMTPGRKADHDGYSKSNRDISSQLESLILAQNERWRQA